MMTGNVDNFRKKRPADTWMKKPHITKEQSTFNTDVSSLTFAKQTKSTPDFQRHLQVMVHAMDAQGQRRPVAREGNDPFLKQIIS